MYQGGCLGWASNDALLGFAKMLKKMENMLFDLAKEFIVSLPHPSIEIRFHDLPSRTPPFKVIPTTGRYHITIYRRSKVPQVSFMLARLFHSYAQPK